MAKENHSLWQMVRCIRQGRCKTPMKNMEAGWWFGTFFIFPYIGNNNPNGLIFFRGVETTNQEVSGEKHQTANGTLR